MQRMSEEVAKLAMRNVPWAFDSSSLAAQSTSSASCFGPAEKATLAAQKKKK